MFIGLVVINQSDCSLKHLEVVTLVLPLMQGLGKPQGRLHLHTALSNTSHTFSHFLPYEYSTQCLNHPNHMPHWTQELLAKKILQENISVVALNFWMKVFRVPGFSLLSCSPVTAIHG